MHLRLTILTVFAFLALGGLSFAADPVAKIEPELLIHPTSVLQPFAGTAQFCGSPGYARPCSVLVHLSCVQRVKAAERFRLEVTDAYGFVISPDSVVWTGPIDSGAIFSAKFAFQPPEVGTYQLTFSRRLKAHWQPLTSLILAISEDAQTVYAGATADCRVTGVPPHPQRDSKPLAVHFPLVGATFDPLLDRHFTGDFRFSKAPSASDTVYIDFALECHEPGYSKVQFVLDYSTNLKPSDLPSSWGETIQLTDSSRFFTGRFWFVPLKTGTGVLNLRVIAKRTSGSQSDRITNEFPIYFVTGGDGKLLLIGNFDPWTRYKDKGDPMLGTVTGLLDVQNRDYRLKQVISKPDYQDEENGASSDTTTSGKK